MRVKTDPVFGRLIIGVSDAVILSLQFIYPFRLALERDNLKIIEIEETEHMSADVENQHVLAILELGERQLLFYIRAKCKGTKNLLYVQIFPPFLYLIIFKVY